MGGARDPCPMANDRTEEAYLPLYSKPSVVKGQADRCQAMKLQLSPPQWFPRG